MEVALSIHFLDSMILFSLIYNNYERDLKKELYLCHKNMNLTMDELYNMTISDRKYFIRVHNKVIEKEMEKIKKK